MTLSGISPKAPLSFAMSLKFPDNVERPSSWWPMHGPI